MGKRYKHLYEKIYDFENLWLASRKARRGKRHKAAVLDFEYDLEINLIRIQQRLKDGNYCFMPYHFFKVQEPQERLIAAAPYRDRVVHHALCNIIEPILDRAMIYDSYACRIGKGSHKAIERAQSFLRKNNWVLKLDIKKYFFTIDHFTLINDLSRKITDDRLITFIERILSTYQSPPEYYFFSGSGDNRPIGLPIGNLTSQLFANYYLNPLDRFIKEKLKIKHYLRYMDDAMLFADNKYDLLCAKDRINHYLETRFLKLHEKKCQLFPVAHGVRFLGYHVYPSYKKILRPNLKRFKKRMKRNRWLYIQNKLEWEKLLCSLNGWLGFSGSLNNKQFVNRVLNSLTYNHPDKDISFSFYVP